MYSPTVTCEVSAPVVLTVTVFPYVPASEIELMFIVVSGDTRLGVAHTVVRVGMPPETPAFDQSTALDESMMPDHCCACPEMEKAPMTRRANITPDHACQLDLASFM